MEHGQKTVKEVPRLRDVARTLVIQTPAYAVTKKKITTTTITGNVRYIDLQIRY